MNYKLIILFSIVVPAQIVCVYGECTCDESDSEGRNKTEATKYKLIAIASILVASAIGVSLPILGKIIPALRPDKDIFFIIKAFAAGVILATGFIHVLPDAFESLTNPCLGDNPWGNFPFAGFVAMVSAIGTLMVDTFATGFYKRSELTNGKSQPQQQLQGDEEVQTEHVARVHAHGHGHGPGFGAPVDSESSDLLRHRIISQVLELGIVVHSVIIGVSLGASESPKTIKPLVAALTFHQFFEGMGLGGAISQAEFKARTIIIMSLFFSLTTPVGIAIGFGVSSRYDENSPTALIVEGIFNSASAGILIYMALVDLLAADFMSPKILSNMKLQLGAYLSLLLGSGFMSLIAKWA